MMNCKKIHRKFVIELKENTVKDHHHFERVFLTTTSTTPSEGIFFLETKLNLV